MTCLLVAIRLIVLFLALANTAAVLAAALATPQNSVHLDSFGEEKEGDDGSKLHGFLL